MALNSRVLRSGPLVARTFGDSVEVSTRCATTNVRVNLFNPGPIRTRMRAQAFPGEDAATLDTPAQAAEQIIALCLPGFTESGKLYNYPTKTLTDFRGPS